MTFPPTGVNVGPSKYARTPPRSLGNCGWGQELGKTNGIARKVTTMLTNEQLIARRNYIGASDVPAILGFSPFATAYDLWLQKKHGVISQGNTNTREGDYREHGTMLWCQDQIAPQTIVRDVEIARHDLPFPLCVHLDGQLPDGVVNAKWSGDGREYGEAGTDEVPEYIRIQEFAEMLATHGQYALVPVDIRVRGYAMFRIERPDNDTFGAMVEMLAKWWRDHIVGDIVPEIGERAPSYELLGKVKREPGSVVELPEDAAQLLDYIDDAKRQKKEAEEVESRNKSTLLSMLGLAEAGRLPDGRLITFYEQERKGYTVEGGRYRVLRIKKG